jgi:glucan phosphoethanolaminetransferase (alkaline phosphatase superfamily)
MIQRIQTVYLFLAFAVTGILMLFVPLWTTATGKPFYFMQDMIYTFILGLTTMLTVVSIISFKKRQNQFVLNRLNIILNLILLGLFVYRSLNLSGEAEVSEKGIGMFLPIVAIVLLVLANKAIKKDEDLVKSVDRLR